MSTKPLYRKGQVLIHTPDGEPVKVTAIHSPNHPTSYAEGQWHYEVSTIVGSIPQMNLRRLTTHEKGKP